MQLSCWLGKLLHQDILEWDLSNYSYTMRIIIMFYCAVAGTTFALTEMVTFALGMFPGRGWLLIHPLPPIHAWWQRTFPQTTGLHLCNTGAHKEQKPQRALKKLRSLNTLLLPSVHYTHDLFCCFFSRKNRGDLATLFATGIQEEEDAQFQNNSSLPWGHLAKWLKQALQILPFPVFNRFNLVRSLHPFCWSRSTGCFASHE